jgi:hypothetical protein
MSGSTSTAARPGLMRAAAHLILLAAGLLGAAASVQRTRSLDALPTSFWDKGSYDAVLADLTGARHITLWTDAKGRQGSMRQFDLQFAASPSAVSMVSTAAEAVVRLEWGHRLVVHSVRGQDHAGRLAELLAAAEQRGLAPRVRRYPKALSVVLP